MDRSYNDQQWNMHFLALATLQEADAGEVLRKKNRCQWPCARIDHEGAVLKSVKSNQSLIRADASGNVFGWSSRVQKHSLEHDAWLWSKVTQKRDMKVTLGSHLSCLLLFWERIKGWIASDEKVKSGKGADKEADKDGWRPPMTRDNGIWDQN